VVIEDVGISTNGFADPIFNNIHLFTYPPHSLTPFGVVENWYRLVGIHEYTHIAHMTKTSGLPKLLKILFGSTHQPNLYCPGWIDEGITVFAESMSSPYEGRLNDGGFDALIKANIKEERFPSIHKVTYSPLEFPGGMGIYLYGGEFFKYLASKYGQEKFSQFFDAQGSSLLSLAIGNLFPALGIDRAAKRVYGKSFPQLFLEWQNTIDADSWKIDGEQLTKQGWFVSSPVLSEDKIFYIRSYPKKTGALSGFYFEEIVERNISSQKEKVVVSSTSKFVGGIEKIGNRLYYAEAEIKRGYANSSMSGFGVYAIVQEKNLTSGKNKVLLEDEIRDFALLSDRKIIYTKDRKHAFGSELWVWSANKGKKLVAGYDYLISEILPLKEDRIAVVARKDWENFNIYLLDLNTKELSPITETPYGEFSISYAQNKLFFSANYEKTYSIYAYNLEEKKFSRLTTSGLACFPVFDETNNDLYFVGLNSCGLALYKKRIEGFDEFQIKDYPESKPPAFPRLNAEKGGKIDYIKTLLPKIHIPYLSEDAAGIFLVGQDATWENIYWLNFWREKKESEFSISCLSWYFKPSILFLNYELNQKASLYWGYPLRNKISQPLSIWLGLKVREFDKFSRKEFSSSIYFSFKFPKTKLRIDTDYFIESKKFGSTLNRQGIKVNTYLKQYIKSSQIGFRLNGVYDPDNPEEEALDIRGYADSIKSNKGATISLEYSRPLLKIRKGIWNPNIFFEDLCLSIFSDAAFSKGERRFSVGVELQQEAGIFFWLNFVSTIGLAYNKEGEKTVYLEVGF
jgi:hypothetical protein